MPKFFNPTEHGLPKLYKVFVFPGQTAVPENHADPIYELVGSDKKKMLSLARKYADNYSEAMEEFASVSGVKQVLDLSLMVSPEHLSEVIEEIKQQGYAVTVAAYAPWEEDDVNREPSWREEHRIRYNGSVRRVAKASTWSEDQAFDLLLSFLGSSNDAAVKLRDALSELAEQEADGEIALPPEAEAWRAFLKLAQQRVTACRGFLVGKMTELFGVSPADIEEPAALEPELEDEP